MGMPPRIRLKLAFAMIFGLLVLPQTGYAQSWAYYMNNTHLFSGLFPGEPAESTFDYGTAGGATIAAHRFSAERGQGRYAITVVDFSGHMDELDGAVAHAAAQVRARGTPGYDAFAQLNGIPGHAISVTEPDGRQTLAQMYLYETRLYIAEGSEPPGVAPAAHFTQSIDIHNPDGSSVNVNPGGATTREEVLAERERAVQGGGQ